MKIQKFVLPLVLTIILTGLSFGSAELKYPLGNSVPENLQKNAKPMAVPTPRTSQANTRQGGENIETAVVITVLPFNDLGTTCGYIQDYSEACPSGSQGPDVVYAYTAISETDITVDMCGSSYDTFIFIYDEWMNLIACNDDYYGYFDPCGVYVSKIEQAPVVPGVTYYIVVSGYSGCGEYEISVSEYEPCVLECTGTPEGEPALHNGYVDEFNGGCAADNGAFQTLNGDADGSLIFCGKSGWYLDSGGEQRRDTDWFLVTVGSTGVIEWTLEVEESSHGMLLAPQDCENTAVVEIMSMFRCTQPTLVLQAEPGDVLWLWVGPVRFTPPSGGGYYEYDYICTFTGLAGVVPVEKVNWGSVKSFYR